SGGEQQRVHFARVLTQLYEEEHNAPKYLLLDEPTASQDIAQQHQLLQLAKQSAKKLGYGVLIVLHDMNLAAQYVDRLLLLKDGQALAQGTPTQVLTTDHIKEAFQVDTLVQKHPLYDCLQIITINQALSPSKLTT
ncbi:MAG: heme ABC transporter ATP-binding protein, partial [Bacteroidota bacterium]